MPGEGPRAGGTRRPTASRATSSGTWPTSRSRPARRARATGCRKFVRRNRGHGDRRGRSCCWRCSSASSGRRWRGGRARAGRAVTRGRGRRTRASGRPKDEATRRQRRSSRRANEILSVDLRRPGHRQVKEGTEPLEAVLAKRLSRPPSNWKGRRSATRWRSRRLQAAWASRCAAWATRRGGDPAHQGCWEAQAPARARPPGHARRHEQPGDGLPGRRASSTGRAALRGDAQAPEGQTRPRPPRHAHQHEQPGGGLPRPPGSSTWPCRSSRRRSKLRKAKLGPDHPDTLIEHEQPGGGRTGCREAGPGPAAVRGDAQAQEGQARPRPPRHAHQHEQPRRWRYRTPGSWTWPCRSSRRRSKLRKAKLGPDHPDTLTSMNNLATGYQAAGKLDLALPLFEETLEAHEGQARPRPSRHAHQHEQPGRATRPPASSTWPCRCFEDAAAGVEVSRVRAPRGTLVGNPIDCLRAGRAADEAEAGVASARRVVRTGRRDIAAYAASWRPGGSPASSQTKFADAERCCASAWPSARRRSPTPGRRSTRSRCSAGRCWARRSTPTPNRCCSRATRG